jgi:hypothetical protein
MMTEMAAKAKHTSGWTGARGGRNTVYMYSISLGYLPLPFLHLRPEAL